MERLIEILENIITDIDVSTCTDLIDGRHLESLDILELVMAMEDEFDVTIPAVEIVPENFNSATALWAMLLRLREDG